MKLGMQLGYDDPIGSVAMAQEADRLGFHSVWTSEAWGADAVTVASWIAATTEQIGIGTAIMQMPARTPAMTAMTVATLDQLSGGRVLLGLGTSGPQVVEGLARRPLGQAARPHARVRRDRPRGAAAADGRAPRRALRHPLLRRGRHRPRQAAEADPEAASPRRADLPRRARPEERRPRRRDRRRLAADLLLPVPLPRAPRPVARARARGVPGRAALRRPRRRRRSAVPRHAEADARPLHRRHGREGARTSTTRSRSATATRRPPRRSRSSTSPG